MIAFAGAWCLDGAPAEDHLQRQLRVLSPGEVQSSHWVSSSSFALGILPLVLGHPASLEVAGRPERRLVVAADARLDNQRELAKQLCQDPSTATAAAVILAAYARWGEETPRYLRGDFAFAVWDEAAQSLLLARDPFGIRPLYYHHTPGRLIAFASRLQAVRALPEVPDDLNPARIVAFLTAEYSDTEATSYTHVRRVAPGHALRLDPSGARSWEYWTLDPDREAPRAGFSEYAEGFRHHFLQAVERCLEPPGPIGALLSGGLDSSGIVAAARRLIPRESLAELPTYSTVFETVRESDEREYMAAALAEGGYRNRQIIGDAMSPLRDLDAVFAAHDEPMHAPNIHLHRAMWAAAQEEGCQVVLDGLDGDTTVSHGLARLGALARKGHLPQFVRESWGYSQRANKSFPSLLYQHLFAPVRARFQPQRQQLPPVSLTMMRSDVLAQFQAPQSATLAPGERAHRCPTSAAHYRRLRSGLLPHVFELATIDAAQFSLEARFPFCDRDLVEYCLSLPADAKLRLGWSRAVMREGLVGILPDKVRLRGGKSDLGPAFYRSLLHFEQDRLTEVLARRRESLGAYLDLKVLDSIVQQFLSGKAEMTILVWRVLVLSLWFEWREKRGIQV